MHTRAEFETLISIGEIVDSRTKECICLGVEQEALDEDWTAVHLQLWAEKNLEGENGIKD